MPTKSNLRLVKPATQKRAVGPVTPAEQRASQPGASDRDRSGKAHRGCKGQPIWSPGRDDAPRSLSTRPAGFGNLRPAMGSDRFHVGHSARSPRQEWKAEYTSCSRRRTASATEATNVRLQNRPFVFMTERGGPFTTDSFNWLVKRAGQKARFPFQVHAHMLRHATGYRLAGDGHDTRAIQDYLGHKNIQHTVRYTELSPTRFKDFWQD